MSTAERPLFSLDDLDDRLREFDGVERFGHVTAVTGTVIRAIVPDVRIGEICKIRRPGGEDLLAEVVGFDRQDVLLLPLGRLESIAAKAYVVPTGTEPCVPAGPGVRGRVLDALGHPIDNKGPLPTPTIKAPLITPPPNPLHRKRITQPLSTGVRALDGMLSIGLGQRVGIFAAAGGGKSTLLSMITRNVDADCVVMALIGERGREVRSFLEDDLGEEGMKRATIVVSTAEQPALLRLKAAYTATAIAEEARSRGERVVLMMDSVTRFARALREVGLAAGEPPGRQGYPASVFATLPLLFERAGNDNNGSITALYTVLVAGDDLEEPVADETISLLDGHIILSRKLAARGHYPAIDVLRSKSRLMHEIASKEHQKAARKAGEVLAIYEENYDKISVGVYESGSDERVDNAIRRVRDVDGFLQQDRHEPQRYEESVAQLQALFPADA
jgi:type III secretion protein N (ATPase)